VHVIQEYDYRFIYDKKDELFKVLKKVYYDIKKKNIPVYMIPDNLKEFTTSKKDIKAGNNILPDSQFRVTNEDIYPEDDSMSMDSSTISTKSTKYSDTEIAG